MSNAKTFQDWAKEILPIVEAAANGTGIEFKQAGVWYEKIHNDLCCDYEYRIKPKTVRIGEYDVPEPMREMPALGTTYYVANTVTPSSPREYAWVCDVADIDWFNFGITHSTRDAAVLHAKALLSLTEVHN